MLELLGSPDNLDDRGVQRRPFATSRHNLSLVGPLGTGNCNGLPMMCGASFARGDHNK